MNRLDLLQETYQLIDRVSRRQASEPLSRTSRQTYSIWMIVKVYLACTWMGWTRNLLYEKLSLDGGKLLRLLQLPNRVPSYSQLNKRIRSQEFERALMGILRGGAGQVLRRLGREELRTTMMDLTNIPTTGREQDAPRGTDGKVWFWGYKLGLLTSQSGVVLGVSLIKANRVERHATHRLLRTCSLASTSC